MGLLYYGSKILNLALQTTAFKVPNVQRQQSRLAKVKGSKQKHEKYSKTEKVDKDLVSDRYRNILMDVTRHNSTQGI